MSSYFIALINIHEPARYGRYIAGFDKVFEQYQGQLVRACDNRRDTEGDPPAGRTILVRFPNDQELFRWYHSEEYQHLASRRKEASVGSMAIVSSRD